MLRELQEGAIPPARVTRALQKGQMLVKWPPIAIRFQQTEVEESHAARDTVLGKLCGHFCGRREGLFPKVWSVRLMTARN